MDLNKAIRKQNKSFKRFLLLMSFIFFILPVILYLSGNFNNVFYLTYLIFIELLILASVLIRSSKEKLEFYYKNNRLKVYLGFRNKKLNIVCDKVKLIHVEKYTDVYGNEDFKIILLATSTFRSQRMVLVNNRFLKNHPYVFHYYKKLEGMHPHTLCYYTIVKRGGAKKYYLLDALYRTCVYSDFTEECIEKIKILRKEVDIDN